MVVSDTDFLQHISYLSDSGQKVVLDALKAAIQLHDGQFRDSGLPFVTHPIAVADYLTRLHADEVTLVAALLHDVVEDNRCTAEQLEKRFGPEVVKLVDGVTKLTKLQYEGRRGERQVASLRKLLLMASEDLRVIFIKLADRWHNVQTIGGLRPDKQIRIADETLDIYVPFARLVGLYELKEQMEDICFPIALPEDSALWHNKIEVIRSTLSAERESFIGRIDLETAQHVTPILSRMSDYEAYTKLQGNIERLQDTKNVDSVLLIVDRKEPTLCYDVLGEVHQRYPVRAFSFKDFISIPQPNGYRALHTTIFLSQKHQVLLRILTREMYDFSTNRKMSSWLGNGDATFMTVLSSLSKLPSEQSQFLSDLRSNVLAGRINVFTTSGEVLSLPKDASGIDFAFALNPDHIPYLAGVRINGESREATATLNEGDTVELILLDAANPSFRSQWVDKARSVEAREAMKENLSHNPPDQQMTEGRMILEMECRKRALPIWWLFRLPALQRQLALALGTASFDAVLAEIGTGKINVELAVDRYKEILVLSPTIVQKILKLLHLLPQTRILNRDAKVLRLEIYSEDRKGLIYDITKCIAERNINIARFAVYAVPPHDALYKLTLEVDNFHEFSRLFDTLIQIPSVRKILRK